MAGLDSWCRNPGQKPGVRGRSGTSRVDTLGRVTRVTDILESEPLLYHQLAYEQANKWCREAIRPWKNKDLSIYIKIDISVSLMV
ncbi:Endogenous retrovirus group K member 9 Pol protein [Manis javanica]|nr:Endogenous retrovirus group K member 9 Pol protein [Manis javanica]